MKEKDRDSRDSRDSRDGRDSRDSREGRDRDSGFGGMGRGKGRSRKDFEIDYKDPLAVGRFVSDGGKITPARLSKFNLKEQKKVAEAVKRARTVALIPSGTAAHDVFHRPEQLSPVPFEF